FLYPQAHVPPASLGYFSAVEWAPSVAMRSASPVVHTLRRNPCASRPVFTCFDRTWPWDMPARPCFPSKTPCARSPTSSGSGRLILIVEVLRLWLRTHLM